ncbi:RecB family exonuclease [Promicromonospora kroppenstedtii]|uniref:RecB family exonuclease n=1 Tax=Promicromonospora kroppenstedtii TaxID=440482 RepID=A0ABW7XHS6_9MICO
MSRPSAGIGWLSPSRAWRLIECPASVLPVAGTVSGGKGKPEVNTGILAHRALERWIRSEGFRAADPKTALAEATDACAAELAGQPPAGWRVSRARLVARGMSLVDLIGGRAPDQVHSEIELKDEDLRLRGRPDLLLTGDEIVVVDLKTQTLREEELPAWVEFQLTVYAHLIRTVHGQLPTRAEVFSLNRGRREVVITDESLEATLVALASARTLDPSRANPSPEVCRFCDRRLVCEPHWSAAAKWPDADAVTGTVERTEHAATGVVALLLTTANGRAWVSGIPGALASVGSGDTVRVARVSPVLAADESRSEWRWRNFSAMTLAN